MSDKDRHLTLRADGALAINARRLQWGVVKRVGGSVDRYLAGKNLRRLIRQFPGGGIFDELGEVAGEWLNSYKKLVALRDGNLPALQVSYELPSDLKQSFQELEVHHFSILANLAAFRARNAGKPEFLLVNSQAHEFSPCANVPGARPDYCLSYLEQLRGRGLVGASPALDLDASPRLAQPSDYHLTGMGNDLLKFARNLSKSI